MLCNIYRVKTDGIAANDLPRRRICAACIREPFLRVEIEKTGQNDVCSYCDGDGKTCSIEELANRVERALEDHFELTPTEPDGFEYSMMKETDYEWHRKGEQVLYAISSAADIDEGPAEDIRLILEDRHFDQERDQLGDEGPFDSGAHYEEKEIDDNEFQFAWTAFERSLKTEARFFSRSAPTTLKAVFEGLAEVGTREGRPALVDAGPSCRLANLYRARVFQSDDKLEEALKRPDLEIGPPPSVAAAAGRMNARGISVFYGASDASAALAEIRPPVGSRVIVGRFDIIRPIRLLDVEALREIFVKGSIFDGGYLRKLQRAKFLESLSHQMTRPVMPDDEPFEYLVTQAIAEYLAAEAKLDGMIYPSAQVGNGHFNVVLFNHASRVQPLDLPKDMEIDVHLGYTTEDGPEIDYWVSEKLPPAKPVPTATEKPVGYDPLSLMSFAWNAGLDHRSATLKLELTSLRVHHVARVDVIAEPHDVSRHRLAS
jgi:RES domain-containing protein